MSSTPKPIAILVLVAEIILCFLIYFFCVYLRRRYLNCKIDRAARQQYCFNPTHDVKNAVVPVQYQQKLKHTKSLLSTKQQQGLDTTVVNSFPIIPYSSIRSLKADRNGLGLDCALCLNPFKDDENLRFLPKCHHVFHPECVDQWFAFRCICPYCQVSLKPPPVSSRRRTRSCSTGEIVTVRFEDDDDRQNNNDGDNAGKEDEAADDQTMRRESNERYTLKLTDNDSLRKFTTTVQKEGSVGGSGHVVLTIGESCRSDDRNPVDRHHVERG